MKRTNAAATLPTAGMTASGADSETGNCGVVLNARPVKAAIDQRPNSTTSSGSAMAVTDVTRRMCKLCAPGTTITLVALVVERKSCIINGVGGGKNLWGVGPLTVVTPPCV